MHRRSLFPNKEESFWRAKRLPSPLASTADPPQTREHPNVLPAPNQQQIVSGEETQNKSIPTTENVMEELREATALYLSCPDPTEAAARRHRVLQGDSEELLARTAAGIIAAAEGRLVPYDPVSEREKDQHIPTQEEVMKELQNVTLQYLSSNDPIENAARRQRVIQGDSTGQMEEAARRIIEAATPPATILPPPPAITSPSRGQAPSADLGDSENIGITGNMPSNQTGRTRAKPARLNSYITSPGALKGACSRKRNLTSTHKSPANSQSNRRRQQPQAIGGNAGPSASTVQPKSVMVPPMSKKRKDFHRSPPPAP